MSDIQAVHVETAGLFKEQEAAVYLGVSRSFLAKSRCYSRGDAAGAGPPWIKVSRAIRYRRIDLDEWIRANTHHPRAMPT